MQDIRLLVPVLLDPDYGPRQAGEVVQVTNEMATRLVSRSWADPVDGGSSEEE